jgi:phosphosulfolactate synthase
MDLHSSLTLPERTTRPRSHGLTVVIDDGVALKTFVDAIDSAAPYVDLVKFGWGTALVTPRLGEKTAFLDGLDIGYFFGGTLFEKFVVQRRFQDYLELCHELGCNYVEISNGTIPMANADKAQFISRAAKEFVVLSEVGYKDQERSALLDAEGWVEYIAQDLAAGAHYVITEARESGRSGICNSDGALRTQLVEEILASFSSPEMLVFEAPTKDLQTFFVTRLGANVNLANIAISDILAVETLRLGLRSDTLLHFELEHSHGHESA